MWAEGIEFTTRSVAGVGGDYVDSPAWTEQIIARKRLFESHCATDESGKVRWRDVARCNMRESQGAKLSCCTLRSLAMVRCDVRVSHPAIFLELFSAKPNLMAKSAQDPFTSLIRCHPPHIDLQMRWMCGG